MLAWRQRTLVQEHVIAAAGVVVSAARGAMSLCRMSAKIEPLALITPTPVCLTGIVGAPDEHVIATAGVIVGAAAGASSLCRVSGEVQPLAFVAPAPIGLAYGGSGQAVVVDGQREIRHLP